MQMQESSKEKTDTRMLGTLKHLLRGNNISEAGTFQTEPPRSEHDFRDPQMIPFVKPTVYMYPHAEKYISSGHKSRLPYVIDIFRQVIEQDSQLCLKGMIKTEYKLRMCGSDIRDAQPSILVGHPKNGYSNGLLLMRKLTRPHVQTQYWYKVTNPGFRIYLWIGSTFQYLGHLTDTLDVSFGRHDWSLTGACLRSGETGRVLSTITCGIRFTNLPDDLFALTTGHAFESFFEDDRKRNDKGLSMRIASEELSSEATFICADVEYNFADLIAAETQGAVDKTVAMDLGNEDPTMQVQPYHSFDPVLSIKPRCVWGPPKGKLDISGPNLDWALIHLNGDMQWGSDESSRSPTIQRPGNIHGDTSDLMVRIMTLRYPPVSGTMSRIPSYIVDSKNPNSFCQVWTVITKPSGSYRPNCSILSLLSSLLLMLV